MNILKISFIAIVFLLSTKIQAQQNTNNTQTKSGKIKFEKTTHDFGKIAEEMKKAHYEFVFTNVGDGPLKVINVKTSCGCTASNYTRTPIEPGKKGKIKVSYSTSRRPGSFRKSITVTVNDPDKPNTVLIIKGFVRPKSKSKADLYPVAMGKLKLMSNSINIGDIYNTQTKKDSIKIYNNGSIPLNISFKDVPSHMNISFKPEQLNIGKEAYIVVSYNAELKKDYGVCEDYFTIVTNDKYQPLKTLSVRANIKQDFSNLTAKQLLKAPKAAFTETTYNFNTVKSGTTVTAKFEFKNTGKNKLEILKVKASCSCTTTKVSKTLIKRNKKGYIEVVFDTSGMKKRQTKNITVITNDPTNPVIYLTITGELN